MQKKTIHIDQTLHGYANGHQLLAHSRSLECDENRILLILSDISGPSMKDGYKTYYTGYPIRTSQCYAFAKSWYSDKYRSNSVFTQTLLIQLSDLLFINDLTSLIQFFKAPDSNESMKQYQKKISLDISVLKVYDLQLGKEEKEKFKTLLSAFYSYQKNIYILSEDATKYEKIVIALWQFLPLPLKQIFTFRTGALSTKRLNDKPFTIQVIPPEIQKRCKTLEPDSKFLKLNHEQEVNCPKWLNNWVEHWNEYQTNFSGLLTNRYFVYSQKKNYQIVFEVYCLILDYHKKKISSDQFCDGLANFFEKHFSQYLLQFVYEQLMDNQLFAPKKRKNNFFLLMTVLLNRCDVNILDEETRAYINNLSINLWRSYPEETFDSFVANLLQGQLQINEQHKILLLGVIENIVDNQSMPLIKKNFNNIIQYSRSFSMHFKLNINNFYLLIELYYLYASNNIKAILKEISNLSGNIKLSTQNFFLSQPNNLRQKLFDKEIPEQKLIFELCKSSYFKAVHPEKFDIKRRTINLWHENKLNALTMTKHLISFNDKSHQICNCFIETVISQCNNECLFKLFENNMEYLCSYINYIPFSIIVQLISDNDLIKDKVGLYLASCKDETNKFSIEIEQLLIILSEIFNKDKHVLQLEEQLIIIDKIKAVTKEKDFIDEKVFEYISNKDLYFFMIKQPTKRLIRQYIDYIDIESIDITNENAEKYLNIFEKCIHTIKEMKSDKTNAMMRILLISGFTLQVHDAYKFLEFSFQYNYDFLYKDDTELFLWQRKMKANEWAIFKERLVNNKENEVIKFSTDKRSLFLLFKLLIEYTKHKQWPRASFLRTITNKATFEEVYRKCKNVCNKYPNEYHFLLGLKDRIIKNTIEYLPFQKDIVLRY